MGAWGNRQGILDSSRFGQQQGGCIVSTSIGTTQNDRLPADGANAQAAIAAAEAIYEDICNRRVIGSYFDDIKYGDKEVYEEIIGAWASILCSKGGMMDAQAIQKDGANARALGLSVVDNPYYRLDQMPAATGETTEEWQRKADAWKLGWIAEDLMRSSKGDV